jgi:hypothetical protein
VYYHHNVGLKYVTYIVCFRQDGGIHGIGAHAVDVEFVRVFYDSNFRVTGYFLSEHGRDQGMYLTEARRRSLTSGFGTLNACVNVVWVARNTHAMYPGPGVWVRGFGFASDVVRAGQILLSKDVPLVKLDELYFKGLFGDNHSQCLALPKEIPGAPTSWNLMYRFLYPLSKRIRKYFPDAAATFY